MLKLITNEAAIDAEDDESISAKTALDAKQSPMSSPINVATRSMRGQTVIPKAYFPSLLYGGRQNAASNYPTFETFNKKAEANHKDNFFMHFG